MIKVTTGKNPYFRYGSFEGDKEVGRVYLTLGRNDQHQEPYGTIEDLYVEETHRTNGRGSALMKKAITQAKKLGCYKLILGSRFENQKVHRWYEKMGFRQHGIEFRMDF